ncbi:MAG TPA: TetR/AcrR family transcriptional regulator [Clostridia bacterium]|jgi:TetR/AcrR family fatty acid metabolism transcriptional regulator|nr:TetR/AcrR family transcriptional regulator [Clostridia bacterium]HHY06013.1 TetR/AcrR family transcriptional regulator [Clostridia bacterium]
MSRKEQIITATIKIIAKKGFADTTIDQIVQEAQVSLSTFYEIFANKEEILEKIFTAEFQKRYNFYINMKNWHIDWFLKINGILNFHLQELQKEPELATVILAERMNPCFRQKEPICQFSQLSSVIAAILQQAINEQKICPCNVQATSLIICGFLDALTYEFIMNENLPQLETAIENFCLLLKNSLAKPTNELT